MNIRTDEIHSKYDISSMDIDEITEFVQKIGEPKFRAKQIYTWLNDKQVKIFDEMTNLSVALREKLKETAFITEVSALHRLTSQKDGTNKFLLKLGDKNCIEAVWMEYKHGASLCISTQVGCRQGCMFCASTLGGLVRSLTAGEMLGEIYEVQRQMGKRISSLVLMGIGEPLDNFDNVMKFLGILSSKEGQNLSLRHVSLSTCGIVPNIYKLAELKTGLTLSVSLHAANNEKRSKLMPVNRRYSIDELMTACKDYFKITGRRISYEYALILGENDNKESADELYNLLKGQNCHINLIPVNPVKERGTKRGTKEDIQKFVKYLENKGMNVTVRRELGSDINAACGQLRRDYENKINEQ